MCLYLFIFTAVVVVILAVLAVARCSGISVFLRGTFYAPKIYIYIGNILYTVYTVYVYYNIAQNSQMFI